jgi:hypothetical protein
VAQAHDYDKPATGVTLIGQLYAFLRNNFKALQSSHSGTTAPTQLVAGMQWYDTSTNPPVLKIYDGASWRTVTVGATDLVPHAATHAGGGSDILYARDMPIDAIVGTTATTVQEALDDFVDPATVGGFNPSGSAGFFHFAGDAALGGTHLQRITNDIYETVGPTGSGATNIWTALDAVPAGAKGVRVSALLWANNEETSGESFAQIQMRMNGSTALPGTVAVYTYPANLYARNAFSFDIPLDSNRRFEMKSKTQVATGASAGVTCYLEGWYC